jgi:hypothetical protein
MKNWPWNIIVLAGGLVWLWGLYSSAQNTTLLFIYAGISGIMLALAAMR